MITGYRVSDYVAYVDLLQVVRPGVRDLAHNIFNDLLVLASFDRRMIDYTEFGRMWIYMWIRWLDTHLQVRGLRAQADRDEARARTLCQWAVEHRVRASQILEEFGNDDAEEELVDWYNRITRSTEYSPSRLPRVGDLPSLRGYEADEETGDNT